MNCQYCDNPIPPNVTNCPSCGAQVPVQQQQGFYQQPAPPQQGFYQQPRPQQQGFYQQPQQQGFYQQPAPPQQGFYQQPQQGFYQQPQGYNPHVSSKSRIVYILLGLLLGGLGVHNFYAGYTTKGIIQLLFTLVTVWFGGAIVIGIWVLIEVCTVKVDVNGNPLQ